MLIILVPLYLPPKCYIISVLGTYLGVTSIMTHRSQVALAHGPAPVLHVEIRVRGVRKRTRTKVKARRTSSGGRRRSRESELKVSNYGWKFRVSYRIYGLVGKTMVLWELVGGYSLSTFHIWCIIATKITITSGYNFCHPFFIPHPTTLHVYAHIIITLYVY